MAKSSKSSKISAELQAAKDNLSDQVKKGWISQGQADAEFQRLGGNVTSSKSSKDSTSSKSSKGDKGKEDKIISELTGDFNAAGSIYNTNFPNDPLGHYTDPRAVEEQNLLNLRNSFADPTRKRNDAELQAAEANLSQQVSQGLINQAQAEAELNRLRSERVTNEAFSGNMSADDRDTLNRMRGESDPNSASYIGKLSDEDRAAIARLRGESDPNSASYVGRMSDADSAVINRLRGESDPNSASYVGGNSADIQDIINRFKGGLEGYTAAENAAFREAGERGLDATAATQRYNRIRDLARNRVRGASASAQLAGIDRNRMDAGRQLEQDIFIKNADEKQNRLKTYGEFAKGVDDTNFARRQGAFGDYRDFLTNREDTMFSRGQQSAKDYRDFYTGREDTAFGRGQQSFSDFRDFLKDREDTAYGRGQDAVADYENTLRDSQNTSFQLGQFNLGQKEKTDARDVGSKMGIVGLFGARRSAKRQDDILGGK